MTKSTKSHSAWWFGTWMAYFSVYWEFHHPNWRTPWFFRGVKITNQSVLQELGVLSIFVSNVDYNLNPEIRSNWVLNPEILGSKLDQVSAFSWFFIWGSKFFWPISQSEKCIGQMRVCFRCRNPSALTFLAFDEFDVAFRIIPGIQLWLMTLVNNMTGWWFGTWILLFHILGIS